MVKHDHILLDHDNVKAVAFKGSGRGDKRIPVRNAHQHADLLTSQYQAAVDAFQSRQEELPSGVSRADGMYLEFRVDERAKAIQSLNGTHGARIMNVRDTDSESIKDVTLFIPSRRNAWFASRLSKYSLDPVEGHQRKNGSLIDSIEHIEGADLRKFFVNASDYDIVMDGREHAIEMWLSEEDYDMERIKTSLNGLGIECGNDVLVFELARVMLIKANYHQLQSLIASVNWLTEFRLHHGPSVLTRASDKTDEDMYATLLSQEVQTASGSLTRIGILDTGAPRSHKLLDKFLPDERKLSVTDSRNVNDHCKNGGHGTSMASLALYGDLADVIHNPQPEPIVADLVSVKITHDDDEGQYSNKLYAIEAQDAIAQAKGKEAAVLCSAITSNVESDSTPTSWSAALDESLYNGGACDSLMLLSVGNVMDNMGKVYPEYLFFNPAFDPAQSWNVLTVGAYTEKAVISDPAKKGVNIVAPQGGMSPFSRSSMLWGDSNIIKPEILMEGGNAYWNNKTLDLDDDLMLVGTNNHPVVHQFTAVAGTSPATALAARLASQIKYKYPNLGALTIRALMVHSAEWTESMRDLATENGKLNKDLLLHTCGYGVPNREDALMGDDSHVTFISEEVLRPFTASGRKLKYANMNIHEIPWPEEALQQLGSSDATMKVTLSYYIDPCPGSRGKLSKYSYQSLRLKFDVIRPEETLARFKSRISHVVDEESANDVSAVSNGLKWDIGLNRRNQGCIISDSFSLTAAQMAKCRYMAIYPSTGWFKYYLSKADVQIKYSLVVSIKTPEEDIYTPIAQKIGIANPIEV